MELSRVPPKEYGQFFPAPFSVFNSVKFSELNRYKCFDIHYLVFSDSKKRLGIILGETDDTLKAPFSASYSGFSFNSAVALQHYDDACILLKEYGGKECKKISFTLALQYIMVSTALKRSTPYVERARKSVRLITTIILMLLSLKTMKYYLIARCEINFG